MRIRVIDFCLDPTCHCLHRGGVILYDGPSPAQANEARKHSIYGHTIVERIHLTPWAWNIPVLYRLYPTDRERVHPRDYRTGLA